MEKSFAVAALIVCAFCFSSVLGRLPPSPAPAPSHEERFFVEGKIYCDPCHLEFETRLSYPLEGVKVNLECRKPDTGNSTYSSEGITDANGIYSVPVEGDHENEICEVKTERKSHTECSEFMGGIDSNRIVLTNNMGAATLIRYANSLGFMTQAIDAQCAEVVKELDLDNLDN